MAALYWGFFWGILYGLALLLIAWIVIKLTVRSMAALHRRTSKSYTSGQYQHDFSDPGSEE